jgi:CheY-like chemotaxis protein
MAPGNWGGLEVIKAIRAIDAAVPLFVVSGRGSLSECIDAMRFGADDYIRKEIFAAEFEERVKPRFMQPYAVEHFPSLIAYLFRVFEEEQRPFAKAKRLIDVFENTIRLMSLMILAEHLQLSKTPASDVLQQLSLDRPSLGHYVRFLFDRINSDWNGMFLTMIRASDFKEQRKICNRLTECRNADFGHSVMISDARATELIEVHLKDLYRILNSMSWLRRFRFLVASALRFDGNSFAIEAKLLRGSNLHHASTALSLSHAITTDHIVAVDSSLTMIDLFPLVELASATSGEWQAYRLYDKLTKAGMEFDTIPR